MNIKTYEIKGEKYCKFDAVQKLFKELKQLHIEGWKGKDKIDISKDGSDWVLKEHRKDRESGEVGIITTIIPEKNVNTIWQLIKNRIELGEKTRYRELAHDIILHYNLPLSIDELNGGKNRKTYFKYYYYPIKICQFLKFIRYTSRGVIIRLI